MTEETQDNEAGVAGDGPRYKLCTFLFGNVDKRGEVEEEYVRNDVEVCTTINHLDNCHVVEVETTMQSIVAEPISQPDSRLEFEPILVPPTEATDYYDEMEVIKLDTIENELPTEDNDEDDYDEPVAAVIETQEQHTLLKYEEIQQPSSPSSITFQSNSEEYIQEKQTETVLIGSVIMPPPLHPAPIAASRVSYQSPRTSPICRGPQSSSPQTENEYANSPGIEGNSEPATPAITLHTPLGNLLPPEYADIDITTLFPQYSQNSTPRWSQLFKLPYSTMTYNRLMQPANYKDSYDGYDENRPHLLFRNYIDLGEISILPKELEQAKQLDEMEELEKEPQPGLNYLAGADQSWWQVAFAGRLAEVEAEEKTRSRQQGKDDNAKKASGENDEPPRFTTWRFGPAKYWYDQLEIPETADITTWTQWCRNPSICEPSKLAPILPNPSSPQTNTKPEENEQRSMSPVKPDKETSSLQTTTLTKIEGQTDSSTSMSSTLNCRSEKPRQTYQSTSYPTCFSDNTFLPYQLTQWEDDIIYDAQLSAHKITASARQNAAYAGWIPSQHFRTMIAFQDAYQEKYPGILGYKALMGTGNNTTINSGQIDRSNIGEQNPNSRGIRPFTVTGGPYAFFPVENNGILTDDWRWDIIYDPEQAMPPPFLLTLDRNDERCVMESASMGGATVNYDDDWQMLGLTGGRVGKVALAGAEEEHAKNARASFNVTFGLAATRGMLTGALAKAEKGAEKVKRILGKHGFLADGEWNQEDGSNEIPEGTAAAALAEVAAAEVANEAAAAVSVSANGGGDNDMASVAAAASGLPPKDPLNLSNDEFYAIRSGGLFGCLARCGPLQHSTPAVELWPPFFPTFNTEARLRQFHRMPLKRYIHGAMATYNVPSPVVNLTKNIQKKLKEREEEKAASGGGDIFFMRTPNDLTGCDGELLFFEYSEEYPPLMMQVGMATRLVNYYRPLQPKDPSLSPDPAGNSSPPDLPYGSLVYMGGTDSPFLGVVRPGGCLQSMENNMYRAPIYEHKVPQTDFLIVRNRNCISIRRVTTSFTVGQAVPLMEVPGPNSKRANNFARDFLQVYILRLFLRSKDEPKRIKMEEIRSAFPNHSESSVRKRLKICADFKRTGTDASWWVLRDDYRLPSEEEIRYLVQPEDVCAFMSMQAAELRLKDAGYGEKSLFILDENQEEEEEKEGQPKMEDEVRAAPWNTTRAYLAAQRGGCFLELHGPADPTGCGEAFSYSKTSAKPGALFRQAGGEVARGLLKDKRTVTGTDADLRKLHLREARALLRSFGISEADLKTFKRWEIIDMVRFTSTERAKQGEEESTSKFARGNRLSMAEQIRCYREECQRIFDLQNRVLSNNELLSSDEEDEEPSSEDEDEELDTSSKNPADKLANTSTNGVGTGSNAIGGVRLSSLPSNRNQYDNASRNIQSMLANRITSEELKERKEEQERKDFKRSVESGKSLSKRKSKPMAPAEPAAVSDILLAPPGPPVVYEASSTSAGVILDVPPPFPTAQKKMLRIVRTYSSGGQPYDRSELVPWSPVVEIYLKIKQTRDNEFIHNFVGSDDQFKEQQRKEKRRIQDQLRRLRKQRARADMIGTGGSGMRDSNGRLIGVNRPGLSRRRHKVNANTLKMRCGACGQTGHMRTNKECPMYGRNEVVVPSLSCGERRGRSGGGPSTSTANTAKDGVEPEAVAAAQELTSKPVAELLAAQEAANWEEVGGLEGIGPREFAGDDSVSMDAHDMMAHHMEGGPMRNEGGKGGNLSDDFFDDDYDEADDFLTNFEENATTVEGTKLKLNANVMRYLDSQKRPDLKMTISRQLLDKLDAANEVVAANQRLQASAARLSMRGWVGGKKRGPHIASAADDDYPTSTVKNRGNRRRIDPRVAINHIFEGIYKGLSNIPGYKIFIHPVKEKDFPNYYSKIDTAMDLSQIRMKINDNAYSTREEFLSDIRLIHDNSLKFNGRYSGYTETAMKMCSHVMEEFCQKEMKLMRLESLVNPLLNENDLVRLSFLLQKVVEAMKSVENSRAFHFPVEKRRYPDYYKIIEHPMDLSTLEKQVKENRYHNREEFFAEAELLLTNCRTFNGQESVLTKIAEKMLYAGRTELEKVAETLDTIEENIRQRLEDVSVADSQSQHGEAGPSSLSGLERTGGPSSSKAQPESPYSASNSPHLSTHDPLTTPKPSKQDSPPAWYVGEDSDDNDLEGRQIYFNSLKRENEKAEIEIDSKRRKLTLSETSPDYSESKISLPHDDDVFLQTALNMDEDGRSLDPVAFVMPIPLQSDVEEEVGADEENLPRLPIAYFDEDTRYSTSDIGYSHVLQETLAACDLQLTDSESSDSLSDQGGELCADSVGVEPPLQAANSEHEASNFTPEFNSEQANDGFELPHNDYADGEPHRVEFFIGSDDEEHSNLPSPV